MKHLIFPLLLLGLVTGILAGGCGEELPPSSVTSGGYPRVVLAELMTTTWCGWCPTAEEAMDRLFDEEGPTKLAVIHWHPSFGQGDPYAIAASDTRVAIYDEFVGDPPGFPVCVYDGLSYFRGGWAGLYDDYRSRYEEEAELGSALQILLEPEISGNSAEIAIEFRSLPTFEGATYDLVVAAVEHHAVEGDHTTSYVARGAVSQDVNLHADHTHTLNVELPLEPHWKREDLWIVAFVQQQPDEGLAAQEVLQATMVPLITAEDDFYAFAFATPDTIVSLASGGEREFPLSIQNSGTLDDTVTVDLPAALIDLPAGWTVGLRARGAEIVTPSSSPIGAGERIDVLRLHVAADADGSGSVGITCASTGDPALVDTLTFHIEAGAFGVALAAEETDLDLLAGTAQLTRFSIRNIGTVSDSILITLPDSLASLPAGWEVSLSDASGNELAEPVARKLGGGSTCSLLRLRVLATGEGEGRVTLVASSQGDPLMSEELEFSLAARSYNFDVATGSAQLQIVVGTPAIAPIEITNTGSRDDLLICDLPDDGSLPTDWEVALVYGEQTELTVPYALLLEQGATASGFGVRISAASSGSATVPLVVSSSGDPSLVDTLTFEVTADAYGLDLIAPQGVTINLSPGVASLVPFELENSGTIDDTFLLDLPAAGTTVPEGWEISLTDAAENPISVPLEVSLAAGALLDTLFIRALAPEGGSGSVELTASSQGLPTLSESLVFELSASQYAFAIEADTDVEAEEVPGFTMAPFTLVNTGAVDDILTISAPVGQQQPPAGWGPAIICDDEQCYPPSWEIDVPVAAGESFTGYYVDWYIPGSGVGTVDLVVVSQGDSSLSETLTFTFTSAKGLAPLGAQTPRPPVIRSSKPMASLPAARPVR